MGRVRVVAHFAVEPDQVDEFIRVASATLVEPTLKEPGCLRYQLCQDVTDPTRFAMIEAWEMEEQLATHLAQESLRSAVDALGPMAAEAPRVQRMRDVGPS